MVKKSFGITKSPTRKMYYDSCGQQVTIKLSKNPLQHGRSKHIDTRFHFLKDHVKHKTIELEYCNTKEQVVDIFTKPLPIAPFNMLREMLGMKAF
jgi:hypothetical protein